jgi:SNF2 family DNA or RNA helicase
MRFRIIVVSKAILLIVREEWPLLIVVPSSLRYQWEGEIIKWLPEYRCVFFLSRISVTRHLTVRHKISVVGSGKDHVNKTINIIPYSLVDALKDEIKQKEFGMV